MKTIVSLFAMLVFVTGTMAQINTEPMFSESEVKLATATGDIYGSLVVPKNQEKSPIVLIIAGSGPTDRDCNSVAGVQTNAYKMLAEEFAQNGISSIRFDKRGIGASAAAMTSEADLRFETYINDVVDWISFIKADKRFSEIVILGHSEGSLIGIVASEKTNIDAFISMAGVGRPADVLLKEQLTGKLPPALMDESNAIMDSLRMGKTVTNVNPNLMALYRPSVQPYMISWMKYDPSKEIAKLKMRILIVQGTSDIQVQVEDAKLLSAANPDAKLLIIENLNHVLKESEADVQKNMATYTNPNLPLKTGLTDELVKFIKSKKE